MLQRIQSVWLLLAALCAIAMFKLTFFSGSSIEPTNTFVKLNALYNIPITLLTSAVAIVALITIFLYSNRPLQIKLCLLGLILQIIVLFLLFNATKEINNGVYALTSIVYAAVPVFYFLAIKGIRQDEKIVKESNRLR
jgi:hypothetical protein